MRFEAAINGIDVDKASRPSSNIQSDLPPIQSSNESIFRDPKEYETMSAVERQKLTNKMLGLHKRALGKSALARR